MLVRPAFAWCLYACLTALLMAASPGDAVAAERAEIDRDVRFALQKLYDSSAAAQSLGKKARSVLVFPNIVKAGFVLGAQYGEGALLRKGRTAGYYSNAAASYGFQAGVESFGYALFFMTRSAEQYLDRSDGWEVGIGPSIVVVDEGAAANLSTTTAKNEIYAFVFDQKGLMAGISLQGSKITRIHPK